MFYATYLLVDTVPSCVDMTENKMPSCLLALQRLSSICIILHQSLLILHCRPHGSRTSAFPSRGKPISSLIQFVFPSTGSSELHDVKQHF